MMMEHEMKLNLQNLKDITLGAVRVTEESDGFCFYRFTKSQEELYRSRCEELHQKSLATSGVRLSFRTDSRSLAMKLTVTHGSSRKYFAVDLWVNGAMVDSLNNFEGVEIPDDYVKLSLPLGTLEKAFSLGDGEKQVDLYFPWSVRPVLHEISLDDGAAIEPIKPKCKLLCFGDSITQGFDALHPSNKYTTRLARFLDAEEINKGIGSEFFFPALAKEKDDFVPDYITVAYGTNDWARHTKERLSADCKSFFENLVQNYPDSKIIVITPIWRKDQGEERPFGDFQEVDAVIRKMVKDMNVTVISGYDFLEHRSALFADLRLHPNDEGFGQYFHSLAAAIQE